MKNKNIIAFIFIFVTMICLISLPVYAAENSFSIVIGMTNQNFEIDGEYTWAEYIDQFGSEDFSYTSSKVYYKERVVFYFVDSKGINVSPDSIINKNVTYQTTTLCEHDYKYFTTSQYVCTDRTVYYTCNKCGYQYVENYPSSIDHNFVIDLNSSTMPTCGSTGKYIYKCAYCGLFNSEEVIDIDPSNHNFTKATCTQAAVCKDCGIEGESALGHDLDSLNRCTRCDYSENIIVSWWSGTVVPWGQDVGDSISNGWHSLTTGAKEVFNPIYQFITGGEDDDVGLPKVLNVIIYVLMIIPIVALVFIIAIVIIKIKKYRNENIPNHKRKKK